MRSRSRSRSRARSRSRPRNNSNNAVDVSAFVGADECNDDVDNNNGERRDECDVMNNNDINNKNDTTSMTATHNAIDDAKNDATGVLSFDAKKRRDGSFYVSEHMAASMSSSMSSLSSSSSTLSTAAGPLVETLRQLRASSSRAAQRNESATSIAGDVGGNKSARAELAVEAAAVVANASDAMTVVVDAHGDQGTLVSSSTSMSSNNAVAFASVSSCSSDVRAVFVRERFPPIFQVLRSFVRSFVRLFL